MSSPSIHPYREEHADGVELVLRSIWQDFGWTFDDGWFNLDALAVNATYLETGGCFSIMEIDGHVIATVGLKRLSDSRCDLARLYLLKEHRGRGLGRILMDHAICEARRLGFREMEIWSDKVLESAHHLYERIGADLVSDREIIDVDQYDEWGFLLELDP